MFRTLLVLAMLVLIGSQPVLAEEPAPEPLSLARAWEMTLQGNPALQASEAELRASEAEILTAGAWKNPKVFGDNGIAEYTYRVGIEQTFELGGKRGRRIALARSVHQLAQAEAHHKLIGLKRELRKAYTQLYTARQAEALYQQHLSALGRTLGAAKADALCQQRLVLLKVALEQEQAQQVTRAIQAGQALNALMNQPLQKRWVPESPQRSAAPVEELDVLLETAASHHPEVEHGELTLEQNLLERKLAQAERIPDLALAAGPDMVFGDEPNFNAFIIAAMELPLFDRKQGELRRLEARQVQLAHEQTVARNKIRLDVANTYTTVQSLGEAIKRYERVLIPESEKLAALSHEALLNGNCHQGIENLRVALDARKEHLELVERQQEALAELETALGRTHD